MRMLTFIAVVLLSFNVFAGQNLEYKSGGTTFEGYLATPTTKKLIHPAVLIVHAWMGPGEFTQKKADEMAAMGYHALAVDMYGKGVRPKNPKEAGAEAGKVRNDPKLMRERIQAAYDALMKVPGVDKKHVVIFGYCFGGTVALELARTGADLAGVVSFHGGLKTRNSADAKKIKAKTLILHGAIDPHVPESEVSEFIRAMNDAKVDYQFIAYSGAVHAFTEPQAGDDPSKGAAYNAVADRRSWAAFKTFLSEVAP